MFADALDMFELSCEKYPDAVALIDDRREVTFRQLLSEVRILATHLCKQGVETGDVVAVVSDRRVEFVTSALALMWLGCSFVALDAYHPPARLRQVLDAAEVKALVCDTANYPVGADLQVGIVDPSKADAEVGAVPRSPSRAEDVCYIVFTSGTRGVPKGVRISRGNVAYLLWACEEAGFFPQQRERVAVNASAVYDASVRQWMRVCRGDTVALVPAAARLSPSKFVSFLENERIDSVDAVPTHWSYVESAVLESLATRDRPLTVSLGGEDLTQGTWERLRQSELDCCVRFWNVYGPSECTVICAGTRVGDHESVSIGNPFPATRFSVDGDGELSISGPGVGLGYLSDHDEGFQASGDGSTLTFRTGDRVEILSDGRIRFQGRVDRQVKLAGTRVELGEIEVRLEQHALVDKCVVDIDSDRSLIVAVCWSSDALCVAGTVVEYARRWLPRYMVPHEVVILHSAPPMTAGGKLNRSMARRLTNRRGFTDL